MDLSQTNSRVLFIHGFDRSLSSVLDMPKRTQPAWSRPDGQDTTKLRLGNGLTGEQEIPVSQFKNRVLWNDWGPTIYDTSHMDHAR